MASRPPPVFDAARERAWRALQIGPSWTMRNAAKSTTDQMPASQAPDESPEQATVEQREPDVIADSGQPPQPAAQTIPVAQMDWQQIQAEVADCQRCGLCEGRNKTVFGTGDDKPRWVIVGEAPGAQEDRAGVPFVGEAGQLLDAMLAAAGARRGDGIYILNVLKCRPPGNRDPSVEEVASCQPFLMRQLELLQPELIITMGRFAAQTVLKTDQGIGKLRGSIHQIAIAGREVPVVAAYHPAYLLRQPEQKERAWADLCLARSVCEAVDQ